MLRKEASMNAQTVTLIAALIAALTSIVTLSLYTRFIMFTDKYMLLWKKELDRLLKLEESTTVAQEDAFSYPSPEEWPAIDDDKLRRSAGRYDLYPEFAKAKHNLNYTDAIIDSENTWSEDSRKWNETITADYETFLKEFDAIQQRGKYDK